MRFFAGSCESLVEELAKHFEREIAEAAVTVLRAGGYSVQVARPEACSPEPARPLCCGRTYLVQGMLDEARMEVRRLSEVLRPQAVLLREALVET
jgi:Fe-S oxidoreductase